MGYTGPDKTALGPGIGMRGEDSNMAMQGAGSMPANPNLSLTRRGWQIARTWVPLILRWQLSSKHQDCWKDWREGRAVF